MMNRLSLAALLCTVAIPAFAQQANQYQTSGVTSTGALIWTPVPLGGAAPAGSATAANQTAVQSAPGSSATTAEGVQGVTGGLPIGVQGVAGGAPIAVQGVVGGIAQPVLTSPNSRTLTPLDVATVTTGGTAVLALAGGHRLYGGWLFNPTTATIALCINEIGAASGTTSLGNTTCIAPGATYVLTPSSNGVSVVSSDSAHNFSGIGLQ